MFLFSWLAINYNRFIAFIDRIKDFHFADKWILFTTDFHRIFVLKGCAFKKVATDGKKLGFNT